MDQAASAPLHEGVLTSVYLRSPWSLISALTDQLPPGSQRQLRATNADGPVTLHNLDEKTTPADIRGAQRVEFGFITPDGGRANITMTEEGRTWASDRYTRQVHDTLTGINALLQRRGHPLRHPGVTGTLAAVLIAGPVIAQGYVDDHKDIPPQQLPPAGFLLTLLPLTAIFGIGFALAVWVGMAKTNSSARALRVWPTWATKVRGVLGAVALAVLIAAVIANTPWK
ncbi:hypothetical protein ACFO3K_01925 [Cellulomonas algicola]|uniref:hypothetical protein n=1 Tax=Cellulomonas algicola TaxID=2071633 RepID=UPI001C3F9985|nr:hypothetical protein [Cellulomonas algicola]